MAIRYWLIPLCMMDIPLISDILYNAMTHLCNATAGVIVRRAFESEFFVE